MQSEHLSNLHPGWVVLGWLVAAAVTAALYVGGAGLGLVRPDASAALWVSVSMAGGFFAGGLLVGMRWSDAPVLHGAAITLFSVLVWFVVTLVGGPGALGSIPLVLGLLLLQLVASCAGGWMGRRVTLGGAVGE
ncbi:MAG TPA: hypothetical protein VLA09_05070 [Longimicrobiales bacterium]|nr:hypothetical protein [Longimicrobiales bacterium]